MARRCCLVLALLLAGAASARERLLVVLVVNGREVATVEAIREEGRLWLPREELLTAMDTRIELRAGVARIVTPLGEAVLPPEVQRSHDGMVFLDTRFLERRLGVRLRFDPRELALALDLPWQPGRPAAPESAELRPEYYPPKLGLATIRLDTSLTDRDGSRTTFTSLTTGGPAARGIWRLRLEEAFAGERRLDEYAWFRKFHRTMLLAGEQRIQLHPVLEPFELTGLQLAWTNRPLEIFPPPLEARELLPRRLQPLATFRGEGPVGAVAQLRVDNVVVAQQTIGLSGQYEFLEVPLEARQLNRVEVLIFDRANPAVPIAIHRQVVSASEYLLPGGTITQLGGLGAEGNALDGGASGTAGFYQVRWGASDALTLEAMAQRTDGTMQAGIGIVARPTAGVVGSLAIATEGDHLAHDLDLTALRPPWYLLLRSRSRPARYPSPMNLELADHDLELGVRPSPQLEMGLIARDRRSGPGRWRFLRPALAWRPGSRLSLHLRPDADGDERLDLWYRVSERARLGASWDRAAILDFNLRLGGRHTLLVSTQLGGELPDLATVQLSAAGRRRSDPWWSIGLAAGTGRFGVVAAANWRILPGVLARAEYQGIELQPAPGTRRGRQIVIGLTADLAFTGRNWLPADTLGLRRTTGAIAGSIEIRGTSRRYPLEGIPVLVDGAVRVLTERGGVFFVAQIEEGIHTVELDTEGLPIELSPMKTRGVAAVAAGAVTRVEFAVRAEYGIAGRITDAQGRPVAGVRLQLLAADGHIAARAVTDRFGLYRMDRIVPGTYTLRIDRDALPPLPGGTPTRTVEIVDNFLFGQDLRLPAAFAPPTGSE